MEDLTKYYSSDAESAMDLDVPLLFLSFPSAKDPNWKLHPGRENKSTMALVTISMMLFICCDSYHFVNRS